MLKDHIDPKLITSFLVNKAIEINADDERVIFLTSLKPFLCDARGSCIEECIKLLGIYSVITKIQAR